MNKSEIKEVVELMKTRKDYGTEGIGLDGLALPDFPFKKVVTKEEIVDFLRWQCAYVFGDGWDLEELSDLCNLLRRKRVIMV